MGTTFPLVIVSMFTVFIAIFLWELLKAVKRYEELPVVKNIQGDAAPISIVVPMRNEERNARRCIESLVSQNYPNFEIIVVDDRSEDGTLSILKELASKYSNLKVMEGTPTPLGWVGKNHALWQGVEQTKGEWLLFVDADTISEPDMLASVMKYVEDNKIDMFSISTFHIMETFWERVIQPVVISSIYYAFPQDEVNDPESKKASASGQFILIKHSVYKAVGGHSAIRDRIVEDFALANLVKSSGYRLRIIRGTKLIKTRMYTNFGEIWEGWTKNLFFGLGRKWMQLIAFIVLLIGRGIVPALLFIWAFVTVFIQGVTDPIVLLILVESFFLVVLSIYVYWRITRYFAIPPYYSLTFPLGIMIYVGIVLSSAYKVASGTGVTWKQRVYRL
ncbi:MAG TPA: glycosyltransferase family 2 protein [Thermodesulfobacteriota bacterium]|nr:glycosyltransferase family 2 protein [Thermodesulfobacteriota bacterium]